MKFKEITDTDREAIRLAQLKRERKAAKKAANIERAKAGQSKA